MAFDTLALFRSVFLSFVLSCTVALIAFFPSLAAAQAFDWESEPPASMYLTTTEPGATDLGMMGPRAIYPAAPELSEAESVVVHSLLFEEIAGEPQTDAGITGDIPWSDIVSSLTPPPGQTSQLAILDGELVSKLLEIITRLGDTDFMVRQSTSMYLRDVCRSVVKSGDVQRAAVLIDFFRMQASVATELEIQRRLQDIANDCQSLLSPGESATDRPWFHEGE